MSGPNVPNPSPVPGSNSIGRFQIGISPIGDIVPFNYWNTILSQYANSSILTTLIGNFFQYINQTKNFDLLYDNIWNINTAQGYGLDVWGRIVRVIRTVQIPGGIKYFGFNEADGPPFNTGSAFFSGMSATQNFILSDTSFRTLIFAKALSNISDGSIPSINSILLRLFPNRGNCYVTDGLNMTMNYTFNFNLSQVELAIVQQSGVLPKPVGVSATVVQL